jgi:hypothetical protein
MTDNLLILQASVTKTATFNSTGLLLTATPKRGLAARVLYSAATNASGANSVTFSLEVSSDNSTYYAVSSAASQVINLSTTAQAGQIDIPFVLPPSMTYVRLVTTVAGAGSTPTVTYQSDIGMVDTPN